MNLQYLTDKTGRKNAVLLALIDWDKIQIDLKELKELRAYREKNTFFAGLQNAFEESKLHSEGKIQLQTAKDFLDEL